MSSPSPPPCPVTGRPAVRLVQTVSVALVRALWRVGLRVDVGPLPEGLSRFEFWESPVGLRFFHPMLPGSAAFYRAFYERIGLHERLAGRSGPRPEFIQAAAHVGPGDRILDVGCGPGPFRACVPGNPYVGIDPHFSGAGTGVPVLAETVEEHAAGHAGRYDAVCAFQVLEHVADPAGFASAMARCARPGGLVMIGVPVWPSPMTEIPNFQLNLVPHHLSWWSAPALRALAGRLGLHVEWLGPINPGPIDAPITWIRAFSPVRCGDVSFAHRWTWHASLTAGYLLGLPMARVAPGRHGSRPNGMLLVARKPEQG